MLILFALSCRNSIPNEGNEVFDTPGLVSGAMAGLPPAFQLELQRVSSLDSACVSFGFDFDYEKQIDDFSVGIGFTLLLDAQGHFVVEPQDGKYRDTWDGTSYWTDSMHMEPEETESPEMAVAVVFLQSLLQGLPDALWFQELPPNLYVTTLWPEMEWARVELPYVEDSQIWVGLKDGALDKIIVSTSREFINIQIGYRDWSMDLTPQDMTPHASGGYWGRCELSEPENTGM